MLGGGTAGRTSRLRDTCQHYAWILTIVALKRLRTPQLSKPRP